MLSSARRTGTCPRPPRADASAPAGVAAEAVVCVIPRASVGVFGLYQREGGRSEDVEVEEYRPVLYVIEVVLDAALNFFARVGFATPAVDLRPSGNAGFHPVAREVAVD